MLFRFSSQDIWLHSQLFENTPNFQYNVEFTRNDGYIGCILSGFRIGLMAEAVCETCRMLR